MSIQSQINRIASNIQRTLGIIINAGIQVAATANSDHLPVLVDELANGDIDCGLFTDAAATTGNIDGGTF